MVQKIFFILLKTLVSKVITDYQNGRYKLESRRYFFKFAVILIHILESNVANNIEKKKKKMMLEILKITNYF